MQRCSGRDSRHPQSCTCLVDAFRTFPAQAELPEGCDAPDCPVGSLDSITLHEFLEVIRAQDGEGADVPPAPDSKEIPIFRTVATRLKRRRCRRPPEPSSRADG